METVQRRLTPYRQLRILFNQASAANKQKMKRTVKEPAWESAIERMPDVAQQFKALSFDEKVSAFTEMYADLRASFDEESKRADARMCFLKEKYETLLRRP